MGFLSRILGLSADSGGPAWHRDRVASTRSPIANGRKIASASTATSTTSRKPTPRAVESENLPVLIVGSGPSGLLLAQSLRRRGIPFRIFEKDVDFTYRGVGWGLTLNWALPILRDLMPDGLGEPENVRNMAGVDRIAVEIGANSQFPYYDLMTAERLSAAPLLPETALSRVTRERLRSLLATDIEIEWNMKFVSSEDHGDSITAHFDDGSAVKGRLLVACEGAKSELRKQLFGKQNIENRHNLPVRLLGVKLSYTPDEIEDLRKLDAFFMHGTSSENNSFGYFSILDAPGNTEENADKYWLQICISWVETPGFMGKKEPIAIPATNEGRVDLFRTIVSSWAEPFRSIAMRASYKDEIKGMKLMDWVPPKDLRTKGRAVLMGDALHSMTMYRGDGANHALADVDDFDRFVSPLLAKRRTTAAELRDALSQYETTAVLRARPGILASRQASLDAHDFESVTANSPLLTPRKRNLQYAEVH